MTTFPTGIAPAFERLRNDLLHLGGRPLTAPHSRLGIVDLSHAYSNLWVEIARAQPHWFGRAVAWSTPLWIGLPIYALLA